MAASTPSPLVSANSLLRRPLGPMRKLLGSRFAQALANPHPVDHYLELVSPVWSVNRIRAEIVDVVRETADVVTLVLRPNENFRGYKAGQYVAITVDVAGTQHTRCFSLSSSPLRTDGLITLTVKARAQGGVVSPYLVKNARTGLSVVLSEAQGEFVLPEQLPAQLLFISGGSGITPGMGMLRTLLASGYAGQIVFVHYARSPEDVIFRSELSALAEQHENLRLVIETESERGSLPSLDTDNLAQIVPGFAGWDCWVCGPQALMNATRKAYAAHGAEQRVRIEEFVLAPGAELEGEAGDISFKRSRKQLEGDGRTLLVQAEAAGLRPKSGCRMGICQSCRCTKLSGTTKNVRTGELSTEDNVEIKLCVSVPVGDVSIDL